MIAPSPATLEDVNIRIEPVVPTHEAALRDTAADGRLWELWYTPAPDRTARYVADPLNGQQAGHLLPWVVRELSTDAIVGSTRYHDIVATIDRVEIGYT